MSNKNVLPQLVGVANFIRLRFQPRCVGPIKNAETNPERARGRRKLALGGRRQRDNKERAEQGQH